MNSPPEYDDQLLARLSEYLDGSLSPNDRAALERDLDHDPHLRRELEAVRKVDDVARRNVGPVPDLDWERFTLESRHRREIYELKRRRRRIIRLFTAAAAAAAIISVAVTPSLWFNRQGSITTTRGHTLGREPLALVSISRTQLPYPAADATVTAVKVSRGVSDDSLVTVQPRPVHKALVTAVAADSGLDQSPVVEEDVETLF
jgi:anti-sigma factor RsiW